VDVVDAAPEYFDLAWRDRAVWRPMRFRYRRSALGFIGGWADKPTCGTHMQLLAQREKRTLRGEMRWIESGIVRVSM
jgi:hypothetical protein